MDSAPERRETLLAKQLAALDASQPWYAPYAGLLGACGKAVAQGADAAGALSAASASGMPIALDAGPLRFVAAAEASMAPGEAYEAHIARTACVPTRDNLHDVFNGLAWLAFPQAKRRLNALQAAEIARAGIGATRGPIRDALTLFDENGAVLDAPPVLWSALLARDWLRLFVTERARWREARLLVFGHALLEKLASPRKAATAHVLLLHAPGVVAESMATGDAVNAADAAIACALTPAHLAQKPFAPLPVLGIPGWCRQNENFSFYDDSDVFRPRRTPEARTTNPVLRRGRTA